MQKREVGSHSQKRRWNGRSRGERDEVATLLALRMEGRTTSQRGPVDAGKGKKLICPRCSGRKASLPTP